MPEAVEAVGEKAQQPFVPGRPGQGWQRRVDKLTKRIGLLTQLVGKLEARIRIQDEMIQKLEMEAMWSRNQAKR
jgi:hypothetical protein